MTTHRALTRSVRLFSSCGVAITRRQTRLLVYRAAAAQVSTLPTPPVRNSLRSFATTPAKKATQIKPYLLADVGEGITECEIIKWFVTPGTVVQEFDPICEVQSDKASVEITSRYAGTVKTLMHKEGDVAKVGQPLCEIEMQQEDGAETAQAPQASEEIPPAPPAPQEQEVPETSVDSMPENDTEMEGFVSSSTTASFASKNGEILAVPAVRRLSKDHNVDLSNVNGTGRDGRITKQDVLSYLAKPAASSSSTPSESTSSSTETIELTPVQRAMFKAMTATLQTPHFAYSDEIDVTELDQVRKLLSSSIPESYKQSEEAGFSKLTMLPLLVKAMSLALYEHPIFRSMLTKDPATSAYKLVRRQSHDVSIALSSRVGLLTPCIPAVEAKSIYDLSASIVRLQARAASTKGLSPADLKATGTITLSNIGAVGGGTYTHPLLPPTGQLAIGALGRSRILPRFASEIPHLASSDPDKIVRRLIMPVSFTGDHRVVEGADLAKLVNRWKQLIENPSLWIGLMH